MNRIDRTLGILLLLRDGRAVSAADLARRFEVSVRTIYRDMDILSAQGVPVYSEMGRTGGFMLREGYFLPPVALGAEEAVTLVLGLLFLRRLRIEPFPAEAETAEKKLMAILPPETRERVSRAERFIGFERVPVDILHREADDPQTAPGAEGSDGTAPSAGAESARVGLFLRALLERSRVRLLYRSASCGDEPYAEVEPCAVLWDRDRWYLAGRKAGTDDEVRLYRADRVRDLKRGPSLKPTRTDFDVASLLERKWMKRAMSRWIVEYPAKIALTPAQAELLKRDWYYGSARFEPAPDGRVVMVYGEAYPEIGIELVRWLGPEAELLEPVEWRKLLADNLRTMLVRYEQP